MQMYKITIEKAFTKTLWVMAETSATLDKFIEAYRVNLPLEKYQPGEHKSSIAESIDFPKIDYILDRNSAVVGKGGDVNPTVLTLEATFSVDKTYAFNTFWGALAPSTKEASWELSYFSLKAGGLSCVLRAITKPSWPILVRAVNDHFKTEEINLVKMYISI